MKTFFFQLLVVILIVAGESLSIYAELVGAEKHNLGNQAFWPVFGHMFLIIACAGALLIGGYILGYSAFKNIWIVSVLSMTSILVVEPFISYAIFHQLPTTGAWLGLGFGIVGSLCAILL